MGPRRVIAAVVAAACLGFAAPAHAAVADGGFIQANNGYYRIIGGAALRVGNCAAIGGCGGAVLDDPGNYLPAPRNGTFLRIGSGPSFGTITRMAGGVPFYLTTCAPFSGCPGTFDLDADGYAAYAAQHTVVADGTYVRVANGALTSLIARAAGGALMGLGTCQALNNCNGYVDVDQASFLDYIAAHPQVGDGAFVRIADGPGAGGITRAVGGALLGIATCSGLNGCPGYVDVDNTGFHSYADPHPNVADGAFLRVMSGPLTGLTARAAGTRLIPLTDCGALAGCPGAVGVDQTAYTSYQDAHPFVADGTVLQGVPSGHLWRITRDGRTTTADGSHAIAVNDGSLAQFPDLDPALHSDADGDGTTAPQDCNDARADIHPGAVDVPGDGIDQDCSGADAAYPTVGAVIGAYTFTKSGHTRFTSLYVRDVPAGSTVTMRCAGRGCPFKTKSVKVSKAAKRLSLLTRVKHALLRKGATFEIQVVHPGMVGRVARLGIRPPKAPKRTNLCLAPGAARASACS